MKSAWVPEFLTPDNTLIAEERLTETRGPRRHEPMIFSLTLCETAL
jgi:hypothetical protein